MFFVQAIGHENWFIIFMRPTVLSLGYVGMYTYFQVIKFWRVYCRFSGLGKPCSYSLYILLYSDGFPARDEILPDTFKCSTIKRNSRTFIFFTELSPPLAQPPRSHHNHHYHPPLSPPLSQPPQLTQASFSHVPLSVFEGCLARKLRFHIFHFQFQQLIQETSEPCHVLHLLAAHLGRATFAKKNSFHGPASGR